ERRTLAVDIGGTRNKLALLDDSGQNVGGPARQPTPKPHPPPEAGAGNIKTPSDTPPPLAPGAAGVSRRVRNGKVKTAPNLGTEVWAGFDLQTTLADTLGKPTRVMNDADVQGFGAIHGNGVEMVLTLGTGAGTSLFSDGNIVPHLELAHHPV